MTRLPSNVIDIGVIRNLLGKRRNALIGESAAMRVSRQLIGLGSRSVKHLTRSNKLMYKFTGCDYPLEPRRYPRVHYEVE